MSSNLKRCLPVLEFISKIKNRKLREAILEYISRDENTFYALKEIAVNIVSGKIKLPPQKLKAIDKFAKYFRLLHNIENNKRRKAPKLRKKLVQQSGGHLQYILPLVLAILSSLK